MQVPETTSRPLEGRWAYLDDLKAVLVAAVIVFHAVIGYARFGSWPYQDVAEVRLAPLVERVVGVLAGPPAFFLMGVFFLVSGALTPSSYDRKGGARFVRDRIVRLGIPVAVWAVVVWPLLIAALHRAAGRSDSSYLGALVHADPLLDSGPLWFVEVLLLFSLGYAGWRRLRPQRHQRVAVSRRTLLTVVASIAIATFLVRLKFPVDSPQVANLHLWQWPQCLGMFVLGTQVVEAGWLDAVPERTRRRAGFVLLAVMPLIPLVLVVLSLAGHPLDTDSFGGGLTWEAASLAAVEGVLAVSAGVWLLGAAQRHPLRRTQVRAAAARSAYAAFLLQGPVLIGAALTMRAVPASALLKAVAVAVTGVVLSFWLGSVLVGRTALGRFL